MIMYLKIDHQNRSSLKKDANKKIHHRTTRRNRQTAIRVGDFNVFLSVIDRLSRWKMNKDKVNLRNITINLT